MDELNNVMKPVRPRKEHVEDKSPKVMTEDQWRQDFTKRFRPDLVKRLKEIDDEEETS